MPRKPNLKSIKETLIRDLNKLYYLLLPAIYVIFSIIILNAIFGGLILFGISGMPISTSYQEHILLLTDIRNPMDFLSTPFNSTQVQYYAYFDVVAGWLLIPAIFGLVIQYFLDYQKQAQDIKKKLDERFKEFKMVEEGKCPICGNEVKYFVDKENDVEGYICLKCDQGDVSNRRKLE